MNGNGLAPLTIDLGMVIIMSMGTIGADGVRRSTGNVQLSSSGAVPTSALQFFPCRLKTVSSFIKEHHYSHTHPGGIEYSFGLLWNGKLAGACVFGWMAGNSKAKHLPGYDPRHFRELMRLVLLDGVPRNSESRFIGWCLRWLKRHAFNVHVVVSFADPAFGHVGTVYRASNWIYMGLQKLDRPRLIVNGKEVHPRMAYDRYGTSSLVKLREMGMNVKTRFREPKHKFVFVLRDLPTSE